MYKILGSTETVSKQTKHKAPTMIQIIRCSYLLLGAAVPPSGHFILVVFMQVQREVQRGNQFYSKNVRHLFNGSLM